MEFVLAAANCRKRLYCETCGLRHPTMLHIYPKEREAYFEKDRSSISGPMDTSLVAVQTGGLTGAGKQECKLAIVTSKG